MQFGEPSRTKFGIGQRHLEAIKCECQRPDRGLHGCCSADGDLHLLGALQIFQSRLRLCEMVPVHGSVHPHAYNRKGFIELFIVLSR